MELAFTMEGLSLSMETTDQALFLIDLNLWEKKSRLYLFFNGASVANSKAANKNYLMS